MARQIEFFVILGYFLPFHPNDSPENQNFKNKWKKRPGDIDILYMRTINDNHPV